MKLSTKQLPTKQDGTDAWSRAARTDSFKSIVQYSYSWFVSMTTITTSYTKINLYISLYVSV